MTVSIFENYKSIGKDVEINYVFDKIRNGGAFSKVIQDIRLLNATDEDAANDLKKTLPGVTFCGRFVKRESKSLVKSTGLIILDFDALGTHLQPIRDQLIEDPYSYAVFISPRGNGLKMLVRMPEVQSDKEFKTYFFALHKKYPQADPSGKDISRFCFISHDPTIHVNENSTIWTEKIDQGTDGTKEAPAVNNVRTDFRKIGIGVQMIEKAEIGNRNNTILKSGRLMGGFIAAGEVNELDVLDIFQRAIWNKDQHNDRENFNTFRRGLEHGKLEPLTKKEENEIEAEIKIGKIEYTIEENDDSLNEMYDKGYSRGYSTGWKHFDSYYSIKPGFTTYIYGAPYTGKSKWWFNVLVNISVLNDLKHVIFSPETGSANDVYAMLIQIYAQGDITNTFGRRITKEKFQEAKTFIGKHFIIISTDETDTELDAEELLNYVDILENKYATKIHTVTIDPWNELEHDDESRDIGLNKELKHVRIDARKNNRHICLITHIRDQKPLGYDELGTAIYPFPTARDVAGGQVWYRKGFMMLAFYRHFVLDGHTEIKIGKKRFFNRMALLIRVQKSKPEGSGKIGEIEFRYHPDLHRFSDSMNVFAALPDGAKHEEEVIEIPF
jgi:hypothetical protein